MILLKIDCYGAVKLHEMIAWKCDQEVIFLT